MAASTSVYEVPKSSCHTSTVFLHLSFSVNFFTVPACHCHFRFVLSFQSKQFHRINTNSFTPSAHVYTHVLCVVLTKVLFLFCTFFPKLFLLRVGLRAASFKLDMTKHTTFCSSHTLSLFPFLPPQLSSCQSLPLSVFGACVKSFLHILPPTFPLPATSTLSQPHL